MPFDRRNGDQWKFLLNENRSPLPRHRTACTRGYSVRMACRARVSRLALADGGERSGRSRFGWLGQNGVISSGGGAGRGPLTSARMSAPARSFSNARYGSQRREAVTTPARIGARRSRARDIRAMTIRLTTTRPPPQWIPVIQAPRINAARNTMFSRPRAIERRKKARARSVGTKAPVPSSPGRNKRPIGRKHRGWLPRGPRPG